MHGLVVCPIQCSSSRYSALVSVYIYIHVYTVEPGYNDIALSNTSTVSSDILWYQLIPHC